MAKSLCGAVLKEGKPVIVKDALEDLDLMSNPLVLGEPEIRFYAGHPIKDSDGKTIGTFCVMGMKPRTTDTNFGPTLTDLGEMAQRELFSVELNNAQSELVAKLGEARRQAMFDPLTRLWNRRGGIDLLNKALDEALRHDYTLGICLADIDNFKSVNAQYGHQVGDANFSMTRMRGASRIIRISGGASHAARSISPRMLAQSSPSILLPDGPPASIRSELCDSS